MKEWNRFAAAQKFLLKANSIHPEKGESDYETMLASQDLYDACYVESFSRERLIGFLEGVISGDVRIPKDVDAGHYKKAYMLEATAVLKEITNE